MFRRFGYGKGCEGGTFLPYAWVDEWGIVPPSRSPGDKIAVAHRMRNWSPGPDQPDIRNVNERLSFN